MLQDVYMQDMQKAEWDGADGKGVTFPQKKPSAKLTYRALNKEAVGWSLEKPEEQAAYKSRLLLICAQKCQKEKDCWKWIWKRF